MEEPAVEAARLELAHRAVIAVRQDRLRAVGRVGDRVGTGRRSCRAPRPSRSVSNRPVPLRADAAQGVQEPVGAVDPVEVAGHLLAEEPAVNGCSGSPRSSTARPSSTVTSMLHVSGQSSGQTLRIVLRTGSVTGGVLKRGGLPRGNGILDPGPSPDWGSSEGLHPFDCTRLAAAMSIARPVPACVMRLSAKTPAGSGWERRRRQRRWWS